MLTTQWTTLCIALAQALLLRHRLPVAFWPAAAVMLAGAAMVIAPSVGQVCVMAGCCGGSCMRFIVSNTAADHDTQRYTLPHTRLLPLCRARQVA